jgi:hypothetical protein
MMHSKRISDTQLEIREGGGCLAIFGLPFFAAGIFMLLAASGVLPVQGVSDMGLWGRPLLAAMGLIFMAVGGWLVFGHTRILIDTVQGSVRRRRGLLFFTIQDQLFDLNMFPAVELGFDAGDSNSADSYTVMLRNTDTAAHLRIFSSADYGKSLEQARQLSRFLKLPLEDASSDHKTVVQPQDVDKPLADRLAGGKNADDWAVRPVSMQSKVEIRQGKLQVRIPQPGFRFVMLLPVLIPLAILYYILPDLLDFFDRTQTPEPVQWVFAGFMLLMFGLFPVLSMINAFVGNRRGYTDILIAEGRISITEQQAWTRKVIVIPEGDVTGLDYGTVQSRTDLAATELQNRNLKHSAPYAGMPLRPLPGWASALVRLAKSKGVTLKHRGGLYTFAAGLPDDEVKYLYSVIRRALAGRS